MLRGCGEIEIDGERFPLDDDHVASVGARSKRKVWPGPDGVRLLVLGGCPGRPYEPPAISRARRARPDGGELVNSLAECSSGSRP